MTIAYVDTSVLAAVLLDEPTAPKALSALESVDRLHSSLLLEAELRSTVQRVGMPVEMLFRPLASIDWVMPPRPISAEMQRVLAAGFLRGADLFHLACALYLTPEPKGAEFLTLDEDQARVARALGFKVRP